MIAYKVTTKGHRSFVVDGAGKRFYHIGNTVVSARGCGPLCVFDTIKHARASIKEYGDGTERIFKCQISVSKHQLAWITRNGIKNTTEPNWLPNGTVLADSVTVLSEVTK